MEKKPQLNGRRGKTAENKTVAERRGNGRLPGERNGEALDDRFANLIPPMRSLEMLTYYQKQISENLKGTLWFGDLMDSWMRLAPTNLWQDILRNWSFSLINFTNQVKGNPEVEAKIVKGVAGYGSQLGTIMDFMEVLGRTGSVNQITKSEDFFKAFKFVDLLEKINSAKGRVEPVPLKDDLVKQAKKIEK